MVYVTTEPRRRGFAYGTLPGHPEIGEKAFIVTYEADDSVWLDITAFSRPGTPLVRTAGPLGRAAQAPATGLYDRALRSLCTN